MIRWFRQLSLEMKLLVGIALVLGASLIPVFDAAFFSKTSGEVTERVRSPDGALDALVVVHAGGGAAGYVYSCVNIEKAGDPPSPGGWFKRGAVYCEDVLRDASVRWVGPSKVVVSGLIHWKVKPGDARAVVPDGAGDHTIDLEYDFKPAPGYTPEPNG